jgi:hypothetical protein
MARKMMVVMGVFDDARSAGHAIAQLKAFGVTDEELSILAHPEAIPTHKRHPQTHLMEPKNGTGMTTAGLAATLVGIGLCAVPLLGLLTAGPLVIAGGVAAVTGKNRPVDDIRDLGVPREDAEIAIEAARRGGITLLARVERQYARPVAKIMARGGAIDYRRRADEWEAEGWVFEPNAPAYSQEQVRRNRRPRVSDPPVLFY